MRNLIIILAVLLSIFLVGCGSAGGGVSAYIYKLDQSEAVYEGQVDKLDQIFSSYTIMYNISKDSYNNLKLLTKHDVIKIGRLYKQIQELKGTLMISRSILKDLWKGSTMNPATSIYLAQEKVVRIILDEYSAVFTIGKNAYDANRIITLNELTEIKFRMAKLKALKKGLLASYQKLRQIWQNLYIKQRSDLHMNIQLGEMALSILRGVIQGK